MANTKISQLTALTNPTGNEELVYAYNNANGKMTLSTMKTFANTGQQAALVSGVNIKTINNTSILGSGNIDVSGGGGGSGPTELAGDANIWELSEGEYITTHDLYYKSANKIPYAGFGDDYKIYLRVVEDTATPTDKGYVAISVDNSGSFGETVIYFGNSTNSSQGTISILKDNEYMLAYNKYNSNPTGWMSGTSIKVGGLNLGCVFGDTLSGSYTLDTYGNNTYVGMEHSIYIPTQTNSYTLTANGVNNPFNITLPSSTTKGCLLKFYCPASNKMILTECLIEQ